MSAQRGAARGAVQRCPGTRSWGRRCSLILAAGLVSCLSLGVPPAGAARPHALEKTIGTAGSGAGEMRLRAAGIGVAGSGIAVNTTTGDVYVADTENHRVDEFDPSKAPSEQFIRAWGWGVAGGIGFEECTPLSPGGCHAGASGSAPGEFQAPAFVAVDNTPGGESENDVYIGDTGDNTVTKFTAEGTLITAWGTGGQLNGSTTLAGTFAPLAGIAVNPANGTLDVISTTQKIFEFEPNATQTNELEADPGIEPRGLALDAPIEGFFTIYPLNQSVIALNAAGESFGEAPDVMFASGSAADSTELYVAEPGAVKLYGLSGSGVISSAPIESFGEGTLSSGAGIAVNAVADPANPSISVTDAGTDGVDVFALAAPSRPQVLSESSSEVTDDSALFSGELNPCSLTGEAATKYHFQYGPCKTISTCAESAYPYSTPLQTLPPVYEAETVTIPRPVQELQPGTIYHYQLIATNSHGETQGTEAIFKTPANGEFTLPDARQWQLVSPPDKQGALIEPIGGQNDVEGLVQAAANGSAITYLAGTATEPNPAGSDNFVQLLSRRGETGWGTRDLTVPHSTSTEVSVGKGYEYRGFSENLETAVVQPFGQFTPCTNEEGAAQPCISPEASEQTAFLENTTTATFTPLETGCPSLQAQAEGHPCRKPVEEHANVPPGTVFGQGECTASNPCGPIYSGGTPDLAHVILGSLAEWSASAEPSQQLRQIGLLPPNGANEEPQSGVANLGDRDALVRHAVSPDGSRVVWEGEEHRLYLRVNATAPQSPISAGKCVVTADACTVEIGKGEYQTANSETTQIFYTNGGELYGYDLEAPEGHQVSELAGGVLGAVIGTSEDASYLYFASNGKLTSDAVAGSCGSLLVPPNQREQEEDERCDLYVRHGGVTALVAVLSGADEPDWGYSAGDLEELTGRVSSDGRWLAFMSQRGLTGYDNADAVSGRPDEEVFLYHAPENLASETGSLACASCDPTGARPHGVEYGRDGNDALPDLPLAGGNHVWLGDAWLAGSVPGWTAYRLSSADYQSRYLSDSGRLFFNSTGALVPKDTNGVEDVYEYEPAGVPEGAHACSSGVVSGSEVFKPEREVGGGVVEPPGCVGLISSGKAAGESAFLDASESGGDVFFLTGAKLSPMDVDTSLDVYDAHECTTAAPCLPEPAEVSPACDTEASCKAAPSPQPEIFGASGSATFSGPGNPPTVLVGKAKTAAELRAERLAKALKQCHKDKKRPKRVACEKLARKKYGVVKASKARRASNERRAGR